MKSLVKRIFRAFGYELRKFDPSISESAQFMRMLSVHNVNLVLDVGANVGQFGRKNLRDGGYGGRIVSFEPLQAAREKLAVESGGDPLWEIAPRAAVGDADGEIEIHVSNNSVSSSVLDMLQTHSNSAPESQYIGLESVPLVRLDSVASNYVRDDSVVFLKIDTQGYEDRVLDGAADLLNRAVGVQLELSLVPLYKEQRLYRDLIGQLDGLGFQLWSISPAFVDPDTGRLLQIDATFFRDTL
jgi:FkbM family methyltransferase